MKPSIKLWAILGLLAMAIVFVGRIGWKKWLSIKSDPLPPNATVAGNSSILGGHYYQVSIPPSPEDNYQSADYRIWIPQDVRTIRGLIVKQHGCGDAAAATGLDHANDFQWQSLARKHHFALLGTKLPTGNLPCENWALINYGSGAAFVKALHALAQKSQHPELERVPWALWGHSGGADWVTQMLQQYPERTIAVIAARGGAFNLLGTNPTLVTTPVLFALGEKDKMIVKETQDLPKQVFQRYRKLDALWALAVEAQTGHETSDTRQLSIPYLDSILTLRLPEDGNDLRPIDRSQGWLGNIVTQQVTPANQSGGNQVEVAWLPNQETARKWQQYVTTGKILPTQKPMVPNQVKATRTEPTTVLLTWSYQPDLANGLPSFRIYRNNLSIATFKEQGHNFGDAPEQPNIVLKFQDKQAPLDAIYSVGAFNDLGESISQKIEPIGNR
ncbi:hypothetical protein [Chamaesiphon polymorphus]|uniref:Fibronectin type-III domain-containing protein n=1 Tax=Chamaesiphon polymorphus CCALA 037 TaxID=2107692 RepID=A0A2T1GMW4_9CYAN|nr:hypothetical protein [Chamaesiphon polymorphus]PSB59233.1 hypothetical protein C7B77_01660 [Chamaesiphon polymorphus CCALA 037]